VAGTLRIDLAVNTTQTTHSSRLIQCFLCFPLLFPPGPELAESPQLSHTLSYHLAVFSIFQRHRFHRLRFTSYDPLRPDSPALHSFQYPHPSVVSLSLPLSFIYITLPILFSFSPSHLSSLSMGWTPSLSICYSSFWLLLSCDISSLDISVILVYRFLLFPLRV
jgi:hypothetical protein